MANRLPTIFQQFFTADPNVREGSLLYSYAAGTSTPLATYTDKDCTLGLENTNPIVLDSLGQPPNAVFLTNVGYKFILKTSAGVTVWTADDVFTSDYSARAKISGYNGNPNTHVAGTAASGSTPADVIMDYANGVLYVCTTTGIAAAAVWTAINASTAANVVPMPQGYLTLTSATPVLASDVTAATTVYYALDQGNLIPVYNGSTFVPTVFTELSLSLVASHVASTIYDIFVFSNSGVLTLVTGPAWTTSTAGSGARGTGASTTELTRVSGIYVNTVQITGRNGSSTYTISANKATYVGSIFMDGSNGQVSCHRSYGQSRKWGLWNAYNRKRIELVMGDATSAWNYTTNTIRQSRADANNVLTTFAGLPEEQVDISFRQKVVGGSTNAASSSNVTWEIGIGLNAVTNTYASGSIIGAAGAFVGSSSGFTAINLTANSIAYFPMQPIIGINNITSLERCTVNTGTSTSCSFQGGGYMILNAIWRG